MIEGHIAKAFDGALSSLHMRVTEMGGLVLDQVQLAIQAYCNWESRDASLVMERETAVNDYDVAIDDEAFRIIARRQPVANDLRMVMAIERAVTDLERVGDEAKKIARLVLVESELRGFRPGPATAGDLRAIGSLAQSLLRSALQSFDRLDAEAAVEVIKSDKELDEEYASALRRLVSRAMEDPRHLQASIEVAFVLKSIERIGDHARNLALHVLYMVQGEHTQTQVVPAVLGNPNPSPNSTTG